MSKLLFGGWSMFALLPAAVLVVGTSAARRGRFGIGWVDLEQEQLASLSKPTGTIQNFL